jgi:L-threonylcarbamoyladenylate synthase
MISPKSISDAATALRSGKLVIFPTETVYGLGADATSDAAVAEIFAAKKRPQFNPLIIHVANLEAAEILGIFDDTARRLARSFWPGPLSLVVPKTKDCPISQLATAGLDTIAIRVPAHPIAQTLLNATNLPVAAPSANVSGKLSPTDPTHLQGFEGSSIAVVLEAGATSVGLESTIISCLTGETTLLRPGGIASDDVEQIVGSSLKSETGGDGKPVSPGQLLNHYAPNASVRLNVSEAAPNEGLLAFGATVPSHGGPIRNLSETGDLKEAAANLFRFLHELDNEADRIAVMPVPNNGLGEAINDRLTRAAAVN